MTFEEANEILTKKPKFADKAWNAFELKVKGSICHSCVRRSSCRARYANDEADWIIYECKFFKKVD